jgi:hypothetical protein
MVTLKRDLNRKIPFFMHETWYNPILQAKWGIVIKVNGILGR